MSQRLLAYAALGLLFLLHNDWWFWSDGSIVLGLPVGLLYHVLYMLATAAVMAFVVRFAWPGRLEVDEPGEDGR
jgi:hypothetical protein